MNPWSPDVSVDEAIAERLLGSRFPELLPLDLRLIGAGMDNQAYLVNESIVFRIPQRKLAAQFMDAECAVLSYLNQQKLPLAIPNPQYIAAPDEEFPYRIAGYPIVEGSTADTADLTPDERAANAEPLGRFLSALHQVRTDVPCALGDNLKRADLAYRLPIVLGRLKDPPPGLHLLLEELAKTPPLNRPPVWVHGDLYSRHVVVDSSNEVRGLIDWGDVHVGDPALDIAIAWMFLPPPSWPKFKAAYGGIDKDTWQRARFRTIGHSVFLRQYAEEHSDEHLLRELEFLMENVMDYHGGD